MRRAICMYILHWMNTTHSTWWNTYKYYWLCWQNNCICTSTSTRVRVCLLITNQDKWRVCVQRWLCWEQILPQTCFNTLLVKIHLYFKGKLYFSLIMLEKLLRTTSTCVVHNVMRKVEKLAKSFQKTLAIWQLFENDHVFWAFSEIISF